MSKVDARVLHDAIRLVISRFPVLATHANPQDIQFQLSRRISGDIEEMTRPVDLQTLESIATKHADELSCRYSGYSIMGRRQVDTQESYHQSVHTVYMENNPENFEERVISYGATFGPNDLVDRKELSERAGQEMAGHEVVLSNGIRVKQKRPPRVSTQYVPEPADEDVPPEEWEPTLMLAPTSPISPVRNIRHIRSGKKAPDPKPLGKTWAQTQAEQAEKKAARQKAFKDKAAAKADAQPELQIDSATVQEQVLDVPLGAQPVVQAREVAVENTVVEATEAEQKPVKIRAKRSRASRAHEVVVEDVLNKTAHLRNKVPRKPKAQPLEVTEGKPKLTQEQVMNLEENRAVKRLRRRLDLTLDEFSKLLDIPVSTIKSWELGYRTPSGAARKLILMLDRNPKLVKYL